MQKRKEKKEYIKTTVDKLIKRKRIRLFPFAVNNLPEAFRHAIVFIFSDFRELKLFASILSVRLGGEEEVRKVRHMICSLPNAATNDFELMGIIASKGKQCLLFNPDDFRERVGPVLKQRY